VHGLAGVIGGMTGAAHGAICGTLLGPVIAANRDAAKGQALGRLDEVCVILAEGLGCAAAEAPLALQDWARTAGLPGLRALGVRKEMHPEIIGASLQASSMKGNPVTLTEAALGEVLKRAMA
jgi:alcohol dehydrogenase class IV